MDIPKEQSDQNNPVRLPLAEAKSGSVKVYPIYLENRHIFLLYEGMTLMFDLQLKGKELVQLIKPKIRPSLKFIKNMLPVCFKAVEVGTYCGDNALDIYHIINPQILYAVDLWEKKIGDEHNIGLVGDELKIAKRLLAGCNVEFIKQSSIEASKIFSDESLDFVYIDADHNYESVRDDIQHWFPKVRKGGILAGHDWQLESVKKAVYETLKDVKEFPTEWLIIKS